MTEAAPPPWTIEEFFAWQDKQPERYELVDGFPVRMMAGAKNVHDDIVVNVRAELRNQLRGGACGRSRAPAASRRSLDKSVVPTSASTTDAGTRTPPRPHRPLLRRF